MTWARVIHVIAFCRCYCFRGASIKFYRNTFFKPPFDGKKLSCIDIASQTFFLSLTFQCVASYVEGDRGSGRQGEKGGERCKGGGRRGGLKREKKGKIIQHCAILRNLKKMQKRREPTNTGREPGLKGTGSGGLKPQSLPPLITHGDSPCW